MSKRQSSMEKLLSRLAKHPVRVKNPLAHILRNVLKSATINGRGERVLISMAEFRNCVKLWKQKQLARGADPGYINSRATGIAKRMAEDTISWNVFQNSIEAIAADGRFEEVVLEVKFRRPGRSNYETYSVDLVSQTAESYQEELALGLLDMGVPDLYPGREVVPSQMYVVRGGYEDTDLYNHAVTYHGLPRAATANEFEGYRTMGQFVRNATGQLDHGWSVKLHDLPQVDLTGGGDE